MLKKMLASLLAISCLPLIGYNGIFNQKKTSAKAAFYENISNEELDENEYISVSIQFDYPDFVYEKKTGKSITESQNFLAQKRTASKKYHTYYNEHYSRILGLEDLDVKISNYAPFAFKEYRSFNEYIKDREKLKSISSSVVKAVNVDEIASTVIPYESIQETTPTTDTISMEELKNMIGVNNSTYTGQGIKVGIFDAGKPHSTYNFIDPETGANSIIATNYDNENDQIHPTTVMSVLGGKNGIAPDVKFYICQLGGNFRFITGLEWFISQNVHIVNMCVGILASNSYHEYNHFGDYDTYSAYLDHIIYSNDLIYVCAAGNDENKPEGNRVTIPGTALNAITVGSINKNKQIAYDSCYQMEESVADDILKPTIVAPGVNLNIQISENTIEPLSGTSHATPVVSGCIALLLQQFPGLINSPEIITSALIAGAIPITGQDHEWDEKAGAGMIRYDNTQEILANNNYQFATIPYQASTTTPIFEKQVVLPPYDFVRISLSATIPSVIQSLTDFTYRDMENPTVDPVFNNYRIEIYKENNILQKTIYTQSNVCLDIFTGGTTTTPYTIKVFVEGESTIEAAFISFSTRVVAHSTHYYIHDYVPYNSTKHKSCCVCGEYILESHVVHSTITPENILNPLAAPPLPGAKTCILCGASVLGSLNIEDGVETMAQITYLTPNGSYQLPNGIIVLNDKDVEAFLNGTLTFGGIL